MDHEKSEIWEVAMRLGEGACLLARQLPREERFGMRSQLTRAAVSVPSNIAEGWRRESAKEKLQFFAIAHGSLAELQTQIQLSQRLGWIGHARSCDVLQLAEQVNRMLTSLKARWRTIAKPVLADTANR
jgi:four helix bundle protein